MDCKDVGELLISYLDGELAEEEKQIVELHLSTCARCQGELESLSATQNRLRRALETVADETPPPQSWARLQQRLAAEQQPRVAVFNLAKLNARRGVSVVKRGLGSRQPVWKPALAGALAVALIVGLALIILPLTKQPQEVLAAEIAQNDPEVQDLLPEGTVVRVTKIVNPRQGGIFHVLFLIPGESIWGEEDGGKAIIIDALVNVPERRVIALRAIRSEETPITPLSVAEKEKAIEIAEADSRVREIVDGGAEICKVIPLPFSRPSDSLLTVNVVGVVLIATSLDSQTQGAPGLRSQRWTVVIDLDEGKVVRLIEKTP